MSNTEISNKNQDSSALIYQKIYDLITLPEYIPCTAEKLIQILQLSDKHAEFEVALNNLIHAGAVIVGKHGRIMSVESSNQISGIFKATSKGSGFLIPDEKNYNKIKGDLFISEDHTMGAITGDRVLAVISKHNQKEPSKSAEGKITRILQRKVDIINGIVTHLPNQHFSSKNKPELKLCVKPYDKHYPFLIILEDNGSTLPSVGDMVSVRLTSGAKHGIAYGVFTENFGKAKEADSLYRAILREHGIPSEANGGFSEQCIQEAERISSVGILPNDIENRIDLRSEIIFTLDGADAKDLDDAISVKRTENGWLLGVHIADVSHYVKPSSLLDTEAFDRGTSVYFTDRVVPMLPTPISNGICSLNANTDRLTLSAFMTIDNYGNIISSELHETVINSKLRGVYSELNDYIEKGKDSDFFQKYYPLNEAIEHAIELYRILDRKSTERGALELETSEAKIILDIDGEPVSIQPIQRGIGEKMIEQFMLCANEAVATTLFWADIPCVYRVHDEPAPKKIRNFATFAHNLGFNIASLRTKKIFSSSLQSILSQANQKEMGTIVSYIMLRSLMKAKYSSSPSPHFGLAIERYCHFTSPIRRYPDLSVHRFVKAMIHGEINSDNYDSLARSAKNIADKSSENELRATGAEMDIEDLFKTKYMSHHIGEIFDGVISSVTPFGFFVELPNTCEGLVTIASLDGFFSYDEKSLTLSCGSTVYQLGQKVRVKVKNVDMLYRKTEFEIVR